MASRFATVARQFSTSARQAQLVKAPVNVFGLEGRYAHALFSAASKEKKLDAVEKELKGFQDLVAKESKLADFINDPSVSIQEKQGTITDIMKKGGASNITMNMFSVIAENRRFNKINGIIKSFSTIMSAHRGEVQCTVTTARPLEQKQLNELKTALQGFLNKGQALLLDVKVEPDLIGGMIVNIGDKYVDMSIASKIKTYSNLIAEPI